MGLPTPIITDGSTDRAQEAPRVVLPENPRLFEERAARFEQLASGHSMGAYLGLMAHICRGQQAALGARTAPSLAEAALTQSRDYGMPPLSAQSHVRSTAWREDLRDIAARVRRHSVNGVLQTLDRLSQLDDAELEAVADRVLAGGATDDDAALVPFIGAALQVYFARQAAALTAADVEHCDVATVCPVCASRPVGSAVRISGAMANLRYLMCALCQTEWNMVRVKCTACESTKGIEYLAIEEAGRQATDVATKAETCSECRAYLKIFNQEKDPLVDPVADDLATLALDVLVDEQGYARTGPNLLFHPGSG